MTARGAVGRQKEQGRRGENDGSAELMHKQLPRWSGRLV